MLQPCPDTEVLPEEKNERKHTNLSGSWILAGGDMETAFALKDYTGNIYITCGMISSVSDTVKLKMVLNLFHQIKIQRC